MLQRALDCYRPEGMELGLTLAEKIARARADLRLGVPIAVVGPAGKVVLAAVETLSPERLAVFRAAGVAQMAITGRRAETLKARAYDGDIARLIVPSEVDLPWITAVADPARDLVRPMKGPLHTLREGAAEAWRLGCTLAKAAQLLPSVVGVGVDQVPEGLTILPVTGLADALKAETRLAEVVGARLPILAHPKGRLTVHRPEDGGEEHYALEIGTSDRAVPVLVRLHSACFTGDVLGSLKCDCGPQLRGALAQMGAEGAGVLLYLNQEGRGIGLANKMRAYALQDQGFDTVEANHRLGFEDDERDFRLGAAILKLMGIGQVRLLTNNPRKIDMLARHGIDVVERVPLIVEKTAENEGYLAIKAQKSGHLL